MPKWTTLDNGIRVITERMEHVTSASVGFYVCTGTSHERVGEAGVSHFVEHLLFKGTQRRSPLDIVLEFDRVGGDVNAATEREVTYYYGRVLGEHVPMAMDVLADMLTCSTLLDEDIDLELSVIAEEISRCEDTPSDLVHDQFSATLWPDHPLGLPILGNIQQLAALGRDGIVAYMARRYAADALIVSTAGDVDHDHIVGLVTEHLGDRLPPAAEGLAPTAPISTGGVSCNERDVEQVHFCVGVPGVSARDKRRLAQAITDCALGGAASSRLFQEIREKRGLAYEVFSSVSLYLEAGHVSAYVGTRKENVREAIEIIHREVCDIVDRGLTDDEVTNAKEHYKGSTLMALDSVHHRMARNARGLIAFGRPIPPEELIGHIEAVTTQGVVELAQELFSGPPPTLVAIGPITEREFREAAEPLQSV